MDMDFLTDPIFSDLGLQVRSDYIGGIDNEALEFSHLDQFIQVTAAVGDIDDGSTNNTSTKAKPSSTSNNATDSNIRTVSARVSLSSAPIATPILATVGSINQATSHLPESPPDSGSEPPYSPLQDTHTGLTLTSRDIYNGLPPIIHQQLPAMHELHMQPQFTPPHQHYSHNLQNTINASQQGSEIRIKHEAGLLMNPTSLATPQLSNNNNNNNPLSSHHNLNDTHIEIPTVQSLYPNLHANGLTHYESLPSSNLFPATIYNQHNTGPGSLSNTEQAPTCMLTTSVSDSARVHVIGTSQATHSQMHRTSAPSTPISRTASSRKRKLSTQLDYVEYANIKPDPSMIMSPNGSSHCGTPHHQHMPEINKLGPTSPVSITVPTHDVSSTPAHSTASLSPALSTVNSNPDNSMDGCSSNNANGDNADANSLTPCIRFSPFQAQNWHKLCDQSLQDLSVVYYRVDADKGFNFSVSDDAFVCQKKNHFQITCHARLQGEAKFVKTPSGLEKIKSFHLHFYGVKLETPNQTIRVEQSQSDRSKKPFYPVPIDLQSHIVSKVTVGRLHFSETTNNNMRKKGRPNPEQRYFQLVVGLHVHTMSGNFPVISQASERIIVRASNPGQFESDVDLCWQRGITQDSIFHTGRVGINTDKPDESLVVHGNLKVSGHIVQPSDSRAKREISELDTKVQLRNLQKIRIVRYRYEPEFAIHSGLKRASSSDSEEIVDTGVIAQEVREVIPDAVQEAGSITLPNGDVIENFLLVNKDRILMENIGAVKELCKVTGSLANRIEHLERVNNRLIRGQEYEQKSIQGCFGTKQDGYEMCSNRALQIVIIFLVIVMATCLAAVSTLYFMEHNKKHTNYKQFDEMDVLANGHLFGHDPVRVGEEKNYLLQFHHIFGKTTTTTTSTTRPPAKNGTKPRQELTYNESGEIFSTHIHNDELTAVMEKPVVNLQPFQALRTSFRMTTTAPLLRNNKTVSSKHKSKWPLAQDVLRSAAVQTSLQNGHGLTLNLAPPTTASVPDTNVERSNASETSSEKVADSIPVPQDFENNSIDIDAQQVTKAPINKAAVRLSNARSTVDLTLKLSDQITSPIVSTSSSNSIYIPDTTASASAGGLKLGNSDQIIYNIYKTALPPTATQHNHAVDTITTSNKNQSGLESGVDNGDALDLQNLSSNNDSADNPITALFDFDFEGGARESALGRRSAAAQRSMESVTRRTMYVRPYGAPAQCTKKTLRDDAGLCQSVCFEDSNQLPPLGQLRVLHVQIEKTKISDHQQQNVDSVEDVELEENRTNFKVPEIITSNATTKIATGKSSHATQAIAKQINNEQQSESTDTQETILEHSNSEENLNINVESTKTVVDDKKEKSSIAAHSLSTEVQRPPALDCWKISSSIVANSLSNYTFGLDDICPKVGKSLNLTYVIPLSRFYKESSIELHLSSSTPLQWTICNNHEHIKRNGRHIISSPAHQHHTTNTLQKRQNTSILYVNIPSRGYFVRDLALRATKDFEKQNICLEKAHEANTLLQYNFRIVRDCD